MHSATTSYRDLHPPLRRKSTLPEPVRRCCPAITQKAPNVAKHVHVKISLVACRLCCRNEVFIYLSLSFYVIFIPFPSLNMYGALYFMLRVCSVAYNFEQTVICECTFCSSAGGLIHYIAGKMWNEEIMIIVIIGYRVKKIKNCTLIFILSIITISFPSYRHRFCRHTSRFPQSNNSLVKWYLLRISFHSIRNSFWKGMEIK